MKAVWLLALYAGVAHAAAPLPASEAAAWLQKMADAARRQAYEGVFVVQQGDAMRTLSVTNRPIGNSNETRLQALDGVQREVRCSETGAVTLESTGNQVRIEKRLSRRHFPDLLPANATPLANWYEVRLGDFGRVAGLDCRNIELLPRDQYRWGYVLCAEKDSGLPLKAAVVNGNNLALMQYAFAEIRLGVSPRPGGSPTLPEMPAAGRPLSSERIAARSLPPGFTRITAVIRNLPNTHAEVEHWVFSDGLTHISLFLAPAGKPVETVKGESARGMINLVRRQVGGYQATVVGDAPWPAVETIALGLEARK